MSFFFFPGTDFLRTYHFLLSICPTGLRIFLNLVVSTVSGFVHWPITMPGFSERWSGANSRHQSSRYANPFLPCCASHSLKKRKYAAHPQFFNLQFVSAYMLLISYRIMMGGSDFISGDRFLRQCLDLRGKDSSLLPSSWWFHPSNSPRSTTMISRKGLSSTGCAISLALVPYSQW